jgi:hypothetical protein
VKLPKILRGAPAAGAGDAPRARRRRRPRPDAPRTIIPLAGDDARPSWLPAERDPHAAAQPAQTSLAMDLDAARERLRRAIPPVDDEQ